MEPTDAFGLCADVTLADARFGMDVQTLDLAIGLDTVHHAVDARNAAAAEAPIDAAHRILIGE